MKKRPKILIFAASSHGGLAEYSFYQATALEKVGARVICLTTPSFLGGRQTQFERIACLPDLPAAQGTTRLHRFKMAWQIVAARLVLAWQIVKQRPDLVLLDSYVEYIAPVWVWPHWILARIGRVHYAANLHDPVRSYMVGPRWWHRLSVQTAYWPLDLVLVHERLPESSTVPAHVRVAEVPHGLFEISGSMPEPAAVRGEWGVADGQKVFLAFGFVRDGKNLDLAVRSLAQVPEAVLVMAGSVAATKDRSFSFYRGLAKEMGVAERCRFFEGFVSEAELGKYFAGTNFVLLTYSASFHSQSGVLNIAARARKPVLASAAPSSLIRSVKDFALGIAVAPDSLEAVVGGMRDLINSPPAPRWEDYEASAGWETNARTVLQASGLLEDTD